MPVTDLRTPPAVDPAPFRVAIAGEFNSGKSSLINLLLRQPVMPVGVTWSRQPPISLAMGNGITLVEIPIDENGHLDPAARAELESADMLIWCTMAQRAWCLSESDLIETLPPRLFDNAVIAVMRSDLLSADAREKVRARVAVLTRDRFAALVMIEAGSAIRAGLSEDATWQGSGASRIVAAIEAARETPRPVLVLTPADSLPPDTPAPELRPAPCWSDTFDILEAIALDPEAEEGRLWSEMTRRLDALRSTAPDSPEAPLFQRARAALDRFAYAPDRDTWAWDLAVQMNDRILDPSLTANHQQTDLQ